jgi:predicted ATPase
MSYFYTLYGETVISDVEFSQFITSAPTNLPDIIIQHTVASEIKFQLSENNTIYATKNNIFFKNQIGLFHIFDGHNICFEEYCGCSLNDARQFVLGLCMAMLLWQQNVPVIHGSVVRYHEHSFIISGGSGAGKSTLTAELLQHGASLISDDLAVIRLEKDLPYVCPGYPWQKLCENNLIENGIKTDTLTKIDVEKNKYFLSRKNAFFDRCSKADAIIYLQTASTSNPVTGTAISGADKLNFLTSSLFLTPFFEDTFPLPVSDLMQCVCIANHVKMYGISRPAKGKTVSDVTQMAFQLMDNTF